MHFIGYQRARPEEEEFCETSRGLAYNHRADGGVA